MGRRKDRRGRSGVASRRPALAPAHSADPPPPATSSRRSHRTASRSLLRPPRPARGQPWTPRGPSPASDPAQTLAAAPLRPVPAPGPARKGRTPRPRGRARSPSAGRSEKRSLVRAACGPHGRVVLPAISPPQKRGKTPLGRGKRGSVDWPWCIRGERDRLTFASLRDGDVCPAAPAC